MANIHFRVWGNVITVIVQNIALDTDALQLQVAVVMQYNHVKRQTLAVFIVTSNPYHPSRVPLFLPFQKGLAKSNIEVLNIVYSFRKRLLCLLPTLRCLKLKRKKR